MRALVLGSGGLTGIAWERGVIAGLASAGIDLADADLVIGTSAGAIAGVCLTAAPGPPPGAAQAAAPPQRIPRGLGPITLVRWTWALQRSHDTADAGRRLGRLARATGPVAAELRRELIAARLPAHTWPERRLLITAVDADSGDRVAFDRHSGVDLVDAVAASCAVPGLFPPVPINGRHYVDGGAHSPANADLAAPADRVVILDPLNLRGLGPLVNARTQAAALSRNAEVVVVHPDRFARRAMGRRMFDPAREAPTARAGLLQGESAAAQVARVWRV
jgi:NTE family protein